MVKVACPVCKDTFKSRGLQRHITLAHPEYRAENPLRVEDELPPPPEDFEEPVVLRVSTLDDLKVQTAELKEDIMDHRLAEEDAKQRAECIKKQLLKLKETGQEKNAPQLQGETSKRGLLSKLSGMIFESKDKSSQEDPAKRVRKLKAIAKEASQKPTEKSKDMESLYDLLYRIPVLVMIFSAFMYLWTHWDSVMALKDNPWIEFYAYLFMTIKQPISMILIVITALVVYLAGVLVYKLVWRLLFPDLRMKSYKEVPVMGRSADGKLIQVETKKLFIPPTRRGRIYLMVGDGVWDRMYRKRSGKPKPDTVTIYYRDFAKTKNPFANPFKVLASCDKGYLYNPSGTRLQKDGLFRRTLIATHMRRDTENESTVWWFENEPYAHKPFESKPYVDSHSHLINTGLGKVSQACGMDSTIQKDQMRNSVSYLPKPLLLEDQLMTEQKEIHSRKKDG